MTIRLDFLPHLLYIQRTDVYIMEECRHPWQNTYLLIVAIACVVLLSGLAIASDSPAIQRATQQVGVISGNETSLSSSAPASFNTTSNPASASESDDSREGAASLPLLVLFLSTAALIPLIGRKMSARHGDEKKESVSLISLRFCSV